MGIKKQNANIRKQKAVFSAIVVLVVLIVILISLFLYLNSQNYISYEPEDATIEGQNVPKTTSQNASAIILNNVLLGGVNGSTWVSDKNIFEVLGSNELEVSMYSNKGLLGTFNTKRFKESKTFYYTKTTKYPEPDEYIAVETKSISPILFELDEIETSKEDEKNVKSALGRYNFLNGSVKIVEAYQTSFSGGKLGKIYSVTSNGKNMFGVYSAVIFSNSEGSQLIKYSYVKDTVLSSGWPVYSIKYVIDLNGDGKNELILQETTANAVRYLVEELKDNNSFKEVLKVSIDI